MKRSAPIHKQKGFTLIEIIATLVLMGILAGIVGIGLTTGVRGYMLASENSAISQKAQLAMTRLGREIQECFDCSGATGNIPLPFAYQNHLSDADPARNNQSLILEGGELRINNNPLIDQVSSFTMDREADGRITLTLTLHHVQGQTTRTFTTSILPRNL